MRSRDKLVRVCLAAALAWLPYRGHCQESTGAYGDHPALARLSSTDSSRKRMADPTLAFFVGDNPTWHSIKLADDALAHQDYKQSLFHLLEAQNQSEANHDTAGMAVALYKMGGLYQKWEVYERAYEHYKSCQQIATLGNLPGNFLQAALLRQGACAQKTGQVKEAIVSYQDLYTLYNREANKRGMRFALSRQGDLLARQDRLAEALSVYKQLVLVEKHLDDPASLAAAYNNIGFLSKRVGAYSDAVLNYLQALRLCKSQKQRGDQVVQLLINIGSVYNQMGDYNAAYSYLAEGLEENAKMGDPIQAADLHNFIAITLTSQGAMSRALANINKAIEIGRRHHAHEVLVRCYKTRAQIEEQLLNHQQASYFYKLYADLKDSMHYDEQMAQQSSLLKNLSVERIEKDLRLMLTDAERNQMIMRQSSLEAEREMRQKELAMLQREKQYQDYTFASQALALQKAELGRKEMEQTALMSSLELQRKDEELKLENWQRSVTGQEHATQIRLLAKDKRILEKGQMLQKLFIKTQNDREKYMLGFVLAALLAMGATYVSLSKIKTANLKLRVNQDEIVHQKEYAEQMSMLLQQKNQSITDSIRYARRIQNAYLPGADVLHQALPLSFVFYKPKDLVSGDFFFLHKTDTHTFVASVDCTGHGVPGAMLAMIGHQALEVIVAKEGVSDPAEVLHRLDARMARVLRVDQTDLQQGMDMGLVVISQSERVLHFAGAVHNLVYVLGGQVHVVKADRFSIGGLVSKERKKYTSHRIPIREGMQCYLASDGMASQLGGPRGKRYGSQRMRELYLQIQAMPSAMKKSIIEKAADEWLMPECKQLDDILVLGFRADLVAGA